MFEEFIKPKEAAAIIRTSRETLRRNYQKWGIRRTLQKPYLYHKSDCLKWANKRFEVAEIVNDPYWERRLRRLLKKAEKDHSGGNTK